MKTIILTCKNNLTMNNLYFYSWMQKRAEMYSAIAKSDFLNLKKVDFYFADPEAGWVDMTVSFDGAAVAELSLSGVWGSDPVADLLIWTENCIHSPEVPHYLYHDGERDDFVFHFESFIFPPVEPKLENGHFCEAGLFSLFLGNNNGKLVYAVCDIQDFRTNLFNAIHAFAERQKINVNAVRDWAWYIYDQKVLNRYKENEKCDDEKDEKLARKMMLRHLKSSKIEKYLQKNMKQ